uniref:protein-tyrosine-phosphatase n=1 Tax=Fopius arisanus TaxID=64838 RepID=A0A0C9RSG0_9HYME
MSSGLLFLLQLLFIISISSGLSTSGEWESMTEFITEEPEVREETEEGTIDGISSSSESSPTTDYSSFIPWDITSLEEAEDILITAVKQKETSESITPPSSSEPSVTPPSIDSKDFLSKIDQTTTSSHQVITNIIEKNAKTFEGTEPPEPPSIPECQAPVSLDYGDYTSSDFTWTADTPGKTSRNGTGEGWSDPDIINSTESSLTVTWKAPTRNISVLYYVVAWFRSGDPEHSSKCRSSNETFNYTITNLQVCTKYTVKLTSFIEGGSEQQRVITATTRLIVEKDSLNLKVSAKGSDWVKIGWNLPNIECVDKYIVSRCNSDNCTFAEISETSYNATDLVPCRKYNFTVSVHGSPGEYGSTSIDSETDFLQPGKPSPAWTEAGQRSLKVFWTYPTGSTCVTAYRVILDDNSQWNQTTIGNETDFKSLPSCRVYQVRIVPLTNFNDSDPEVIQSNRTFPAVLNPPGLGHGLNTTSTRISLTWRVYTNEDNNCENTTLITQCNSSGVLGHGYEERNGTTENIIPSGTKSVIQRVDIENLSPFTQYSCYASAGNSQGMSGESADMSTPTSEEVPSAPANFSSSDETDTEFMLSWKAPPYLPGTLVGFEMELIIWPLNTTRPSWCEDQKETNDRITKIGESVFSWRYENATPFSMHKTKIRAQTNAGWGNWSEEIFVGTRPGAPGPVSLLNYSIIPNVHDPDVMDFTLSWGQPCSIHGERIEYYNVTAIGERRNYEPHKFEELVPINPPECVNEICRRVMKLREEYTYTFHIAGKGRGYPKLGERNSITAMFPAGIPPLPSANYTSLITIDPYKARRTTSTAAILLPVFPETYGKIHCYAIIVAKSGYNNMTHSRINLLNGEWPDTPSWSESKSADFEIPYQAVKFCDHNPSYIVDYGNLKAVNFVLGDDTETCPELSSNHGQRSYCNGPLKPDTWYDVRIRAFTNGGYQDSTIFTVKTNAEMRVAVVIGTIFGILFLGILTTLMLLVRKCSIQAVLRRFLHSDMPGSPVPAPFTRRKFITHCQQLADNPGKLSNEFQLLQTLSVDLQMPTNAACLQANRKKNRYTDILPYDFSRVKLEPVDTDPNSDYINASFIKGCGGEEEYIACQGPKEETTYDFWRMVNQYDVKLIVMLTQLVEKNKEKCHQYFPTMKETFTYENMSIRCTTEFDYRTYTQRTLVLQKENEKRTIIHLHFKDWPDHDVPEDFDPMINFCQIIRRYITSTPGLAVVHCSAGIGRTGTLIAIDILLQHIKENRKLDVFGTVYRLRHHRINMVQRESQYAYIYNCIKQVLKNPYFSKTYKPPSVDPITVINGKKKEPAITNLVSSLETRM